MVISTYSNILLSVSMINIANVRVSCGRERPLRLFEVLARNRQSALGRGRRTRSAREQPNRMFTIPPRQQLSSPTRLAIRTWRVIRRVLRLGRRRRRIAPRTARTREREKRERTPLFALVRQKRDTSNTSTHTCATNIINTKRVHINCNMHS